MYFFTGLKKIQDWTKQSLKKRLAKSLSHDWINEKTSHKFPLRRYYVQLRWKKKVRTAMRSKTVTLTSIHDLIKQLMSTNSDVERADPGGSHRRHLSSSVIDIPDIPDVIDSPDDSGDSYYSDSDDDWLENCSSGSCTGSPSDGHSQTRSNGSSVIIEGMSFIVLRQK